MATLTLSSGNYVFANGTVSFRLKPDLTLDQFKIISLSSREVMYWYPTIRYYTDAGVSVSFYGTDIGNGTLTPSSSPATTVTVTYTKTYTDTNGVTHSFTILFSLTDGESRGKIVFQDIADTRLNKVGFTFNVRAYPQGYTSKSAASANMGGDTTYTDPLTYDGKYYVYKAGGDIEIDDVVQLEDQNIDNYACCYYTDASVGIYGHYADLQYHRMRSYTSGELIPQTMLLIINPRTIHDYQHEFTAYFGGWADGSAASIQSEYGALCYVEDLEAAGSAQFTYLVRTDLNTNLHHYNEKFEEILDHLKSYNRASGTYGNTTMVPAGNPDWQFFKYRNNTATWNRVIKDTGEDYVQKSIDMCRSESIRLYVEIDILDALWNTAHPDDAAIGTDEVTPYTTTCKSLHSNQYEPLPYPYPGDWYITYDGGDTWEVCPICGGTGLKALWVKMMRLVTSGQAYHDAFLAYVTYLCENYNFYALILSECFYEVVDFSSEAKAQFMADTGETDWPRSGGSIDTTDETLGNWKTAKLSALWDELTTIAHANNKKFFLMVKNNFSDKEAMARAQGQYWPTAIQHCDGLDVWDYYGANGVSWTLTANVVEKMLELQVLYPTKENIIAIGMWNTGNGAITVDELYRGLNYLWLHWYDYGWGVEVTPSRFIMDDDAYWRNTLWGEERVTLGAYQTRRMHRMSLW